ncbi:3-oxoacyl-ACP synthase [Xenorhabdus mauleonii]|uniref:3-oxoacyl-ACP synthase n=1 Tax=Xenorhabdus mauleonii TaxID=351675 RepID=A0A1I3N4T9_9GAMM|nr:3-oxoacyl-[acyl-carrier-protein] synthase III C-terminal domain-containing protein [Xenorhabdus mauleonii]PHM45782.1 3-oxoacyl-ACP synthase [Xenorhabdus mauleonii]SFJ04239.1 3-oxoacyl-[acyl-carrier-protein] synthase III [Xenorhabdus mauleonii]
MNNGISIISAAGILPTGKIIIHPEENINNEFSAPGKQKASRPRTIWRLNNKDELIELIKVSLLEAVKQVQMDISDIDYLILSQVWFDNILGDESGQLARELKLSCPVVPINVGTSGGITSLELASSLFINPKFQNIAVIAGCNYSHWFSESDPARTLLSDGAACLMLSRKQGVTVAGCQTVSTAHYDVLQFNREPVPHVRYKPQSGDYIFNNLQETTYRCCNEVCQANGINLNDVSAFYIYDPTEWAAGHSAEALGVEKDKVISIFHKYGSLGPAQSLFGFMEIQHNKNLTDSDWVVVMGIGPSFTATAALFKWQHIPNRIYCYDHKTRLISSIE